MEIEALQIAIKGDYPLVSNEVFVRISRRKVHSSGKEQAAFSAKVYRINAGFIELASSGVKRLIVGHTNGRHAAAEKALDKLGYDCRFSHIAESGESVYTIHNLT